MLSFNLSLQCFANLGITKLRPERHPWRRTVTKDDSVQSHRKGGIFQKNNYKAIVSARNASQRAEGFLSQALAKERDPLLVQLRKIQTYQARLKVHSRTYPYRDQSNAIAFWFVFKGSKRNSLCYHKIPTTN